MDCFTLIFASLIIIVGISEGIAKIRGKNLNKRISEALKKGDIHEYAKLINLRDKNEYQYQNANENYPSDMDYFEAMFILDAAEQGVFFPNGHEVFERLDNRHIEHYEEFDDSFNDYEYYDDYYDEHDGPELDDHWGLG